MKVESLVIAEQQAAVNTFPGLVHTARHGMGVGFTRRRCANRKEAAGHGRISDWAEVEDQRSTAVVRLALLPSDIQKGGDPAAGSPTATLLRLHPSR